MTDATETTDARADPPSGAGRPEPRDAEPVVELADVTRAYERGATVEALSAVSLSLAEGSYTAVMGPSGSGKSTLLNLVGGLDTPTAGTVRLDGQDLASLSDDDRARVRGRTVGFVFQTFNLMPRLTAVENVALPLVFQGWGRADRRERAEELLADVGLGDRLDHRPTELSGGQRQRVAIARALAADPALLLADEPTGNVDTETGERIMALFEELHEAGNTILLVTHERHIAEHADRIVHVRDGQIEGVETVADGTQSGDGDVDGGGAGTGAETE
ncbi:ABC transporter ATP-binding protein [Halosimplex amylolyticum]|uniref:ABC transporter ATP-binding protein n=1 Tax=Halosimplex amylolyticum TaxID=3396616 RepID=UPI003F57FE00